MFEALPFGSDKGLRADGEISRLARSFGLSSFAEAARRVQRFPYGRNTNRADYRLVLAEMRGTCSTKHALLAALAAENQLEVDLVLAVYEMTEANTPGVGAVLSKHGLTNIPEAHCYLRSRRGVIDVTMPDGPPAGIERCFLHEEVIPPAGIGAYKVGVHRRVLEEWLRSIGRADLGLDGAWAIREACIISLSAPAGERY